MTRLIQLSIVAAIATSVAAPALALPVMQPTQLVVAHGGDSVVKASMRRPARTPSF